MTHERDVTPADEVQRALDAANFQAAVNNELTLYRNTGDARFVWRAVMRYHEANITMPAVLVAKLAEWGGRVQTVSSPDAIVLALELKGSAKDKIGPSHSAAYRRRWRLASEVQLLHRLAPDKTLDQAIENVARNRRKSIAQVKRAYHDVFTASMQAPDETAAVQGLIQTWR